jgi:hypothetical protein
MDRTRSRLYSHNYCGWRKVDIKSRASSLRHGSCATITLSNSDKQYRGFESAVFYANKREARKRRFNLLKLLNTFQSTLKHDIDHVFELLSMALGGNEEEFVPQYGSIDFNCIACRYGQDFVRQDHSENG